MAINAKKIVILSIDNASNEIDFIETKINNLELWLIIKKLRTKLADFYSNFSKIQQFRRSIFKKLSNR
jgi:hypothetical protein